MKLKQLLRGGKGRAVSVQTARRPQGWEEWDPGPGRQWAVYRGLRQSIPLIDAALDKTGRLVGGCRPVCDGPAGAQAALEAFFRQAPVGASGRGLEAFLRCYLDSLLTYGTAVGELVLDGAGHPAGLYIPPPEAVRLRPGENPLEAQVCAVKNGLEAIPVKAPQLVVYSALNPKPGALWGTSILEGLPFVADILRKIYASMGQNFERTGNLRYAVTYKPGAGSLDRDCAQQIAEGIAQEWAQAMEAQRQGQVRDFVAVGDVEIKVIGADSRMIDTEVPVRQMLEQIVAKLGIPPFLLGLHWSTTERMSAQQADILTSELESYRRLLDPVLEKLCTLYLQLEGYGCRGWVEWEEVNLQDQLADANARLVGLQADQLEHTLEEQEEAYGRESDP